MSKSPRQSSDSNPMNSLLFNVSLTIAVGMDGCNPQTRPATTGATLEGVAPRNDKNPVAAGSCSSRKRSSGTLNAP